MAIEKTKIRFGLHEIIDTLILILSIIVVRQGVVGISIMGSVIFPMLLQILMNLYVREVNIMTLL